MNTYVFDSAEPAGKISKLSILYVEEDSTAHAGIISALKHKVAHLYVAQNSKDALKQFKKMRPNVLIVAPFLSGTGSAAMISRMKKIDPFIPVIITVGSHDHFSFLRLMESAADAFITKPVNTKNLLTLLQKIANRIVQQKELEAKNHFVLALLDINPSYLAVYGDNGLIYLNRSFKRFLGVKSVAEFKDKYGELACLIIDKETELTSDLQLGNWAVEHTAKDKNGHMLQLKLPQNPEKYSFLLTTVPITSSQEYLLTFTDITKIEKEKQHYQFLAEYDALTKIFNRNKINKEMNKETIRALRYRHHLSILMIDVDYFKRVNDTYGHQVGDVVLIELSALIQNCIRQTDVLGRWGGEEFILLMPSTPLENAVEIANRLLKSIATHHFTGTGHVTCSIGVAEYQPGESPSTFIKRSDDALYTAKRNGRNRVEVAIYTPT